MAGKKHLLLLSPVFFPSNPYHWDLISEFQKLSSDWNITVLCYKNSLHLSSSNFDKVNIIEIDCFPLLEGQLFIPNYFQLWRELSRLKRTNPVSVILAESRFFESSWWAPVLAKIWGVPALIMDHCSTSFIHKSRLITLLGKVLDHTWFKFWLNCYSLVLVSSRATMQYLDSLGIKNLKMISTGVDADLFNPIRRQKIRTIPHSDRVLSDHEVLVTFLTRLVPAKKVDIFYESLKLVFASNPNVVGVIAGWGQMYDPILKLIKKDKLEEKCLLIGGVNREEASQLYANTDIFVHPSGHHEGLPKVVMEAGASGCAVIASTIGGTGEVIIDNQTGILVANQTAENYSAAILDLASNKEKRQELASNLRSKLVQEYAWEAVASRVLKSLSS